MKRVFFRPQAVRDLEALPTRDRDLVEDTLSRFAETGIGDVKLLAGRERHYRLRAGDWRVRFIFENLDIIRVLSVRNRRDPYR
ncbi:MAG: type II toxin-antitoxin system RelE/ParE family toxin [Bryobacteraceae bacterium]